MPSMSVAGTQSTEKVSNLAAEFERVGKHPGRWITASADHSHQEPGTK